MSHQYRNIKYVNKSTDSVSDKIYSVMPTKLISLIIISDFLYETIVKTYESSGSNFER